MGQSNERGDGGIYIGSIMKGGAVAADGRIEPGDMLLQVCVCVCLTRSFLLVIYYFHFFFFFTSALNVHIPPAKLQQLFELEHTSNFSRDAGVFAKGRVRCQGNIEHWYVRFL